jgi:hypothetical protein
MSRDWDGMAKALAQWLEAKGVGNWEDAAGGDLFAERQLPTTPHNAMLVRSSGGFEGLGVEEDQPTFQFVARGANPQWALNRLQQVYDQLHGRGGFALPNGVWVTFAIATQSGPAPAGQDPDGRWLFTSNYRLMVEPT